MKTKIELRQNKRKDWYWVLVSASNGRDLAVSETYSSKRSCKRTAHRVAEQMNCKVYTKIILA